MYRYRKLVNHVERWVSEVNEPLLNRAWEIVKESVNAHAIVDREEDQSARLARGEAWRDWCVAWAGEDSTFALAGLVSELACACPEGLEEQLEQVISDGHCLAQGLLDKAKRVKPVEDTSHPALSIVWNRSWDEMEN